jgi:hypothetical protein
MHVSWNRLLSLIFSICELNIGSGRTVQIVKNRRDRPRSQLTVEHRSVTVVLNRARLAAQGGSTENERTHPIGAIVDEVMS